MYLKTRIMTSKSRRKKTLSTFRMQTWIIMQESYTTIDFDPPQCRVSSLCYFPSIRVGMLLFISQDESFKLVLLYSEKKQLSVGKFACGSAGVFKLPVEECFKSFLKDKAIRMKCLTQGATAMASGDLFYPLGLGTSCTPYTPFTKTSPNYPHKNNADNSIKIAFTNSELPKIIHTLFTSAH